MGKFPVQEAIPHRCERMKPWAGTLFVTCILILLPIARYLGVDSTSLSKNEGNITDKIQEGRSPSGPSLYISSADSRVFRS